MTPLLSEHRKTKRAPPRFYAKRQQQLPLSAQEARRIADWAIHDIGFDPHTKASLAGALARRLVEHFNAKEATHAAE